MDLISKHKRAESGIYFWARWEQRLASWLLLSSFVGPILFFIHFLIPGDKVGWMPIAIAGLWLSLLVIGTTFCNARRYASRDRLRLIERKLEQSEVISL
jgi:hypothetical protein